MNSVPPELLALIVDETSDSTIDLKNISLVSRSLRRFSRELLYRHFRTSPIEVSFLYEEDFDTQLSSMIDMFSEHLRHPGDITKCVKVLFVDNKPRAAGTRFGGLNVDVLQQQLDRERHYDWEGLAMFTRRYAENPVPVEEWLDFQIFQRIRPTAPRKREVRVFDTYSWPPDTSSYREGGVPEPVARLGYRLADLPFTNIQYLSYDWKTYALDAVTEGELREMGAVGRDSLCLSTFVDVVTRNCPGLKHLFLTDAALYIPQGAAESPSHRLFECLAGYAPLLETLCLSEFRVEELAWKSGPRSLADLQSDLQKSNHIYGAMATGKRLSPRRFFLRDPTHAVSNKVTEVLLFGSGFLDFSNLVYLALDSRSIPFFVNRAFSIQNVTHLTLYDSEFDTYQWKSFDKSRLSLPSLIYLQLMVRWSESILPISRAILGSYEGMGTFEELKLRQPLTPDGSEYPGARYFTNHSEGSPPQPPSSYPQPGGHLQLHIEFSPKCFSRVGWKVHGTIIDSFLYPYLSDGHPDRGRGPLSGISVNMDMKDVWPLTASTGRLSVMAGDHWWKPQFW